MWKEMREVSCLKKTLEKSPIWFRYNMPIIDLLSRIWFCYDFEALCTALPRPSSETQGQLVGAGERLNRRGKKSGEEKSRTKVGAPGILLLTDQFRNHLKSLPVIGHKNIFCAQSESSSFRVTFVTSYSKLSAQTSCSPVRRLFTCSCRRVSLSRKVPLKRELWNRKKKLQM